jgi:O-antigen/teichoic acid export membrane protein
MLAVRQLLARILVGELGPATSQVLVPLAIVSPLAFAGFVATIALTTSGADRRVIFFANAIGATLNLSLAFLLIPHHRAFGASLATAIGLAVSQSIILRRLLVFRRRLRYSARAARPPASIGTSL